MGVRLVVQYVVTPSIKLDGTAASAIHIARVCHAIRPSLTSLESAACAQETFFADAIAIATIRASKTT
jgi:hypothetical protein